MPKATDKPDVTDSADETTDAAPVVNTKPYKVLTPLKHNGETYTAKTHIELDAKTAAPLLKLKAIQNID